MKLGVSPGSVPTAEDETWIGSDQTQDFCLFVFSSFPQDGVVHQHQPGTAHPGSPGGRIRLGWEMVRARPAAGRARVRGMCGGSADAAGRTHAAPGRSFHRREPQRSVSEGRVSEPQFNKPSAAAVPIPRKLIKAARCRGSALLRQTGSGATVRFHGRQAASLVISPASSSSLTSQRCF